MVYAVNDFSKVTLSGEVLSSSVQNVVERNSTRVWFGTQEDRHCFDPIYIVSEDNVTLRPGDMALTTTQVLVAVGPEVDDIIEY